MKKSIYAKFQQDAFMDKLRIAWFSVLFLLACVGFARESDLDEWLELDLNQLMNIKVSTATKKDQIIQKVPATVRIITANQIKERAYHSLEDVLQDLPGFQFRDIQGFNSYTFLRGAPNQNNLILVLIDGIQINELNSGGFYGGFQYNLQNVKQIEVVYGPSSALYGTNAISGIINIITKDAGEIPKASTGITIGSFGTLFGDCSYRYYSEKSSLSAAISTYYNQTEKADLAGAEGDWYWSEKMENFERDAGLDTKITYKDFLFGITLQDRQASRTTIDTVGSNFHDAGTNFHIRFLNAYLKHSFSRGEEWALKSQLYYRNTTVVNNTIYIVSDTGQVGCYRPNALIGIEEQFNYNFSDCVDMVAGLVLESEKLAEDFSRSYSRDPQEAPPKPANPDFKNNTLASLYTQIQVPFLKYYEFTAGSRLDHSSYYGNVLTPRLGLVYYRKIYSAKLLYTEAFRAPKPWDYKWSAGNPDLQPEKMNSVEFANIFNPNPNLRFDWTIYLNRIYNKLTQTDSCWGNSEKMNTKGMELAAEYHRGQTEFFVNYTYTDSKFSDGKKVPEIARHAFNLGFQYAVQTNLKFIFQGNYLSRRLNPEHTSTPANYYVDPYFVLNGIVNYKPNSKIELQVAVKNMLNARYYHTSNLPPLRYRQPQRAYYFRLSYYL